MKGRSAVTKAAAVCALAAVMFLTQCDDGGPPSLFPPFLPLVTHHINLGASFQPVPGDSWFFFVMPAATVGTDIVYVVHALPDGSRRAVLLNSALRLFFTFDSPYLGGAHLALTGSEHLAGMCGFNFAGSVNSIATAAYPQTTIPDPAPYRDGFMLYSGGTASLFTPTTMVGGTTQVSRYDFTYSANVLTVGGYTTYPVQNPDVPNRFFVLEGAGNDGTGSWGCLVFRDHGDNRGYLFRFGTFPGVIDYAGFWPLGERLASGTTRFAANGDPVIQLDSGRLQRWRLSDLGLDQGGDGHFYNGWYMAYDGSDNMYLFNPDSLELIKTRAWWRDYGN